jgi:hypothetical protein
MARCPGPGHTTWCEEGPFQARQIGLVSLRVHTTGTRSRVGSKPVGKVRGVKSVPGLGEQVATRLAPWRDFAESAVRKSLVAAEG